MRTALVLAALLLAASPAGACLPPPPDWVEPTAEEVTERLVKGSEHIVGGTVAPREGRDRPRFTVDRVYKGDLKPGQILEIRESDDAGNIMCPMQVRPPLMGGKVAMAVFEPRYGRLVILYQHAEIAFAKGWLPREGVKGGK